MWKNCLLAIAVIYLFIYLFIYLMQTVHKSFGCRYRFLRGVPLFCIRLSEPLENTYALQTNTNTLNHLNT